MDNWIQSTAEPRRRRLRAHLTFFGGRFAFERLLPPHPALSLGEREPHPPLRVRPARGIRLASPATAQDGTLLLPLPNPDQSGLRSEGRGEGEQDDRTPA